MDPRTSYELQKNNLLVVHVIPESNYKFSYFMVCTYIKLFTFII